MGGLELLCFVMVSFLSFLCGWSLLMMLLFKLVSGLVNWFEFFGFEISDNIFSFFFSVSFVLLVLFLVVILLSLYILSFFLSFFNFFNFFSLNLMFFFLMMNDNSFFSCFIFLILGILEWSLGKVMKWRKFMSRLKYFGKLEFFC